MKKFKLSKEAEKFINLPPVDYDNYCSDPKNRAEFGVLMQEFQAIIETCASKYAYLEERYGSGCGDQGHKSAVKNYNKVLKKVRAALGFFETRPLNF